MAIHSKAKLLKIENGHVVPSMVDAQRILTSLDVSEEVKTEYMAAARAQATEATA